MDIRPPYGYQEIVPLTKTHKVVLPDARKLPVALRELNAMPLSFTEFAVAGRDYPIAFISGDGGKSFVAMAVLGLENGQNLLSGTDDAWEKDTYIPAYVRRYPFCMTKVTVDGKEQAERIACVEKRALSDKGDTLFDAKGEALPAWEERQKLLFDFETDLARTEEMCRALAELGVLEPFNMQAVPNDGTPVTMTGMFRVSEQKLAEADAEKLKALVVNGVMARIYVHLVSLGNFVRLLDRRAAQAKTGGAALSKKPESKKPG
jgi:hypothetical protein